MACCNIFWQRRFGGEDMDILEYVMYFKRRICNNLQQLFDRSWKTCFTVMWRHVWVIKNKKKNKKKKLFIWLKQ